MGLFFAGDDRPVPPAFARGFDRYRLALEGNWKRFLIVDFLTLLGLAPFALGTAWWLLATDRKLPVLLAVCVVGGLPAGPAVSGMTDCIFRALRFNKDDWWGNLKKAWKQNFRGSLLPGIVFCVIVGMAVMMAVLLIYGKGARPGFGTVALLLASFLLASVIFLSYWPQLVLFEQKNTLRLKNCLLFTIKHFWRVLGVAALNTAWWALAVLLFPFSAFLVPFLGVWVIHFVSFHLLYDQLNEDFQIEKQIFERFPEQRPETV